MANRAVSAKTAARSISPHWAAARSSSVKFGIVSKTSWTPVTEGLSLGCIVGACLLGENDGLSVGNALGSLLGATVGDRVVEALGSMLGADDGGGLGTAVGIVLAGAREGLGVGNALGSLLGAAVGDRVGATVVGSGMGLPVGSLDGGSVAHS